MLNSGGGGSGRLPSDPGCRTCGSLEHQDRNCPVKKHKLNLEASGLTEDQWKKLTELMKEKAAAIKNWAHVPDDANITIEMNGKVVSQACRHCRRMTRGTSMHDTGGHKGRNKVAYRSPDGGSAPAPAPAPAGPSLSASLAQGPAPAP